MPKLAASGHLPPFREPQLATLVPEAPKGDDWLHELKFDGYRIVARLQAGAATLLSRRGLDWTAKFPGVRQAVEALPVKTAILDGEVAVALSDGRTSFQALQNVIGGPSSAPLYYVFDLLFLDGEEIAALPLETRKEKLKKLLTLAPKNASLRFSDHFIGQGEAFYQQAASQGLEGIISKRRADPYHYGRGTGWLKVKAISRQEFVIDGFTDPEGARDGIGALLIGYYDDQRLAFAGKVGTGFTQKVLRDLRRRLGPLEQKDCPFAVKPTAAWLGRPAHWVRPELVAEIAFAEWTNDGRLRHPSFQGMREDKLAKQVKRETPDRATKGAAPSAKASVKTSAKPANKTSAKPAKTSAKLVKTSAKTSEKPSTSKNPEVLGQRISHPERVVYPKADLTKLDVARYYEAVGEAMLPHIVDRPLSLVRCPEGLAGDCFYAKHTHLPATPALHQVKIREKTKAGQYLVLDDKSGLVALAQFGVLEIHTWNSTAQTLEMPNRFVLDLDPGPDVPWKEVVETALFVRKTLEALHLKSFLKTTGGKGLHVVVPLEPVLDWEGSFRLSEAVSNLLVRERPTRYTTAMAKVGREKKILIDYFRNNRGSTSVAAFSTRAREPGTVSVPLAWDEAVPALKPETFTIRTVPDRLATLGADPWADYFRLRQKVPADVQRLIEG